MRIPLLERYASGSRVPVGSRVPDREKPRQVIVPVDGEGSIASREGTIRKGPVTVITSVSYSTLSQGNDGQIPWGTSLRGRTSPPLGPTDVPPFSSLFFSVQEDLALVERGREESHPPRHVMPGSRLPNSQ